MKVLLVTGIFPPDAGGPARYVPQMASALAREHEVVAVITLSDGLDHDDGRFGFRVIRIARNQNRLLRRWRTVSAIARAASQADVVYLNGLVLEGMLATRLLARRPAVIKVVGDLVWEQARNRRATALEIDAFQRPAGKGLRWRALRWLQGRYTAAADRVLAPSGYLAAMVEGWGVPAERIRVVRNAVPAAAGADQAPTHDIVTVGRLTPWKGVDGLIDVAAERRWSLLVVGDGDERTALEARAARLGAAVTFAGQAPQAEVAGLIRQGRVFVLNSSYEGLPHVVIEAKLAGRAVVATAVGGTPETIRDGVDGRLVPYGDRAALTEALAGLLADPAERLRLAEAGRADALARFSFETMYAETVAVLAEAVERHA
jgi:glycosyltransferase involved in cell wall biosynthesis